MATIAAAKLWFNTVPQATETLVRNVAELPRLFLLLNRHGLPAWPVAWLCLEAVTDLRLHQFGGMQSRRAYSSDVSSEEWALVAPYLTLLPEAAAQREHSLRKVFIGLQYVLRYGVAWRAMPHDLPPWHAVYDQAQRWLRAGCLESLVHDLRDVLRLASGRTEEPSAVVLDSRTLRSKRVSDGGAVRWQTRFAQHVALNEP